MSTVAEMEKASPTLREAGIEANPSDPKGVWRTDLIPEKYDPLIAAELMDRKKAPADAQYGVYFVDAADPASILAKRLEETRFGAAFADNDPEFFRDKYGPFEANGSTTFIVILDHESRRPVGMIRTIRHTEPEGSRTTNDLVDPEMPWGMQPENFFGEAGQAAFAATDLSQVEDIATLAKAEDWQDFEVLKAVFSALFRRALADPNLQTWVTALDNSPPDNDPYGLVQWWTKNVFNTFRDFPNPVDYYGSNSVACWSNFREYEQRLAAEDPERHAQLAHSSDLQQFYFDPDTTLF